MKLKTSLLLFVVVLTGCLNAVSQLIPLPDAGVDAGVDAGMDAGPPPPPPPVTPCDAGSCTVEMAALGGCFCVGQPCQPELGSTGGCIPPLFCYSRFNDAGLETNTCCDLSSGSPVCGF